MAVGLGTAAFSMQDILLEPYGGEILHLAVGATTTLTALIAGGALVAFALAARWLGRGADPHRLAAFGALAGIVAFSAVIFAEPLASPGAVPHRRRPDRLRRRPVLGRHADRGDEPRERRPAIGLALGAWGAVQATAAGARDRPRRRAFATPSSLAAVHGALGPALMRPGDRLQLRLSHRDVLLFATLVAIGPLVAPCADSRAVAPATQVRPGRFPG